MFFDDKFPTPSLEERYPEPIKFLPVVFVLSIIGGLYYIYVFYHIIPGLKDPSLEARARIEAIVFHLVTFMLLLNYTLSVCVHPGTIPEKEEDPSWEYEPQEQAALPMGAEDTIGLQEKKRSGQRRHCKWCLKYKPDRCHHCRVCRMCILKMDHHCPWIYNCVGFRNYKFFFLLLLFTTIDCHFIVWTMSPTVRAGCSPYTPFLTMFLLLFGETLAGFLGAMVTGFFGFHIYLMLQAMTTIEFCEHSKRRQQERERKMRARELLREGVQVEEDTDSSIYDKGCVGNISAVLGDNPLLWFLPVNGSKGRGLTYATETDTLRVAKDRDDGRGMRRRVYQKTEVQTLAQKRRDRPLSTGGGTGGSTGQSEEDSVSGSGSEEATRAEPDLGSSKDRMEGRPVRSSYGATDVGGPGGRVGAKGSGI